MRRRAKWAIGLVLLAAAGGGAAWWAASRREEGVRVATEPIVRRSLEAVVSASGKVEPRRSVNISAQSMGRVTRLAVQEGERVRAGQFLLQIDPVNAATAVARDEAALEAARRALEQARVQVQSARVNLDLARQTLKRQQDLWEGGLTTREQLDRAQAEVDLRESELRAREQEVETRLQQLRQQEASLASSRHNLAQVRFEAPFDGIVTRRNIEEGENVVVGTMNNPGTVLLTIADMSIIEAQVEVDETDLPLVSVGQEARVTIDALPNRTFRGRVTEIGNSPVQTAGQQAAAARTATVFKVKVTLEGPVPDVRPGFTCTAEITTATREAALAVPIQALAVRELEYDRDGQLVRRERPRPPSRWRFGAPVEPAVAAQAPPLPPGHTRKEVEGVFVVRDGRAVFVPLTVGIAGERYFEVLSGLEEGDEVITGPFDSVRNLIDGDRVRPDRSWSPR